MGREEQTEEREVLDSIFPDEITGIHIYLLWPYDLCRWQLSDISETAYRISIALDITQHDDDESEPRKLGIPVPDNTAH